MSVLEVRGLCKSYSAFKLENVDISLEQGKITGFIGRNGAGKTTTLKAIMDFVHPDAGEILLFDRRFAENENEIKQRVGFVTGGIDYYGKKKIKRISAVTSSFYKRWDAAAYAQYMKLFALDENKTPSELSEGMKVKYALTLAAALALTACGSNVKLDPAPVYDSTTGQSGSGTGTAGQSGVTGVDASQSQNNAAGPQGVANVVYFDFDSFVVRADDQDVVQAHARYLQANKSRRVVLEGNTDERGGREYNLALGQKRSEAVRRSLNLLGVPDAQIEAVSYGEEKPAAAGADEDSYAQNRRVEFKYQ